MLKSIQHLKLSVKTSMHSLLIHHCIQNFERTLPILLQVQNPIDFAHAPGSQVRLDLISFVENGADLKHNLIDTYVCIPSYITLL